MATDYYQSAIDAELERWPNVSVDYKRRSRHREATLTYHGQKRKLIFPTSGSDHRGHKNAIADLRKELRTLGASRLQRVPVSKRERELLAKTSAPARMSISERQVKLLIPEKSPLFAKFADKNGHAKSYWSMYLRANPDPKGKPFFVIEKRPAPEPGKWFSGITKGCMNAVAHSFMLSLTGKPVAALLKHGPFGTVPIEHVSTTENEVLFKLPDERPAIRERKRKEAPVQEAPAPTPEPQPEPPAPAPAPTPEPVAASAAPIAPMVVQPVVQMPEALNLQMPREPISMERAVAALNRMKDKLGDDIHFVVGAGGYLVVRAKLGGMPRR